MGYILYRGSRDQLNELCRIKDERIALLVAALEEAANAMLNGGRDTLDQAVLDQINAALESKNMEPKR